MANFIFGENNSFSIHYSFDKEVGNNSIVNFYLCCGGVEIGEKEHYVELNTIKSQFLKKIINYDYTLADELTSWNKERVVDYIVEQYEKSSDWKRSESIDSIWLSLDLSPSTDGDIVIWLRSAKNDRLIWKPFKENTISELFLLNNSILEIIQKFIEN